MSMRRDDPPDRELREWLDHEIRQPAPTRGLDATLDRTRRMRQRRRATADRRWVLLAAALVLISIVAGLVVVGGTRLTRPAPTTPVPTTAPIEPSPSAALGEPVTIAIPDLVPLTSSVTAVDRLGGVPATLTTGDGTVAVPIIDGASGDAGLVVVPTGGAQQRTFDVPGEPCWGATLVKTSAWMLDCGPGRGLLRTDLRDGRTSAFRVAAPECDCHDWAGAIVASGDSIWATTERGGPLRRIDPDGTLAATTEVGEDAAAIAVGAGSVWVTAREEGVLRRLDAESGVVVAEIPVPEHVRSIAVLDEHVWLYGEYEHALVEVDPATNSIARRYVVNLVASALVPGGGGTLWINDAQKRLFAFDTVTGRIVTAFDAGADTRGSVTVGYADGDLWIVDEVGQNLIRVRVP